MSHAITLWTRSLLARAWNTWRHLFLTHNDIFDRNASALAHMLRYWQSHQLSRAWRSWRVAYAEAMKIVSLGGKDTLIEQRKAQMLCALTRWMNLWLGRGWNTWRECYRLQLIALQFATDSDQRGQPAISLFQGQRLANAEPCQRCKFVVQRSTR